LEPIGHDRFRFGLESLEQRDFTYVEFLFNNRDNGQFHLPGEKKIKCEMNKAILSSFDKLPYLAPEIVLFYKSSYLEGTYADDHNQDFDVSLPYFNTEQKQWLRAALEGEYPDGHVWLQRLR
jgi:hypothetical protein